MSVLLPVAEAQARLLALAAPLPIEPAPLVEATGRFAAEAVIARRSQPSVHLSAMDGYALRFADMPGPWTVVGQSAAGRGLDRALTAGQAARIFTGAPLPVGADTVLLQEEAARDGDRLTLAGDGPTGAGDDVRHVGSDFAEGARLIEPGHLLNPARIALAAMGGHGTLAVPRRVRIALLSTGDELVPPGTPAPPPLLPASNGPMLAALLAGRPVEIMRETIVPDRLDALVAAFAEAATIADVVVTTGGVSVGDHDLVRPALLQAGATLDFWKVAMRPGKPLMAGRLGRAILLGLPGNPVSAFVTAHLFLLPLIRHLGCDPAPLPPVRRLALTAPLGPTRERADYLRARIVAEGVAPLASRDSALLAELARADGLIARPAHAPPANEGEYCDVHDLA